MAHTDLQARPPVARDVDGRLHLVFSRREGNVRTTLRVQEQRVPLQVVRAFPIADGGALVHLHNLSGGVLGGDQLRLAVDVEVGAYAQLTTTGATRLYRRRAEHGPAVQRSTIWVGPNALLEYVPDPLLPYRSAAYRQHTSIELAEGAGLLWWEIIAPGREAHGEVFAYDLLENELSIVADGRPVVLERTRLQPAAHPLPSPLRFGPYRYYASFYICRVGVDAATWRALEAELAEEARARTQPGATIWAASTLPAHGLAIRGLSHGGRAIYPGLVAFWDRATQALYGRAAIPPRKLY